jgi:hypothetical protein
MSRAGWTPEWLAEHLAGKVAQVEQRPEAQPASDP